MISCDLRGYDLYLHSVFYMHKLLLYEVGTEKGKVLTFQDKYPYCISIMTMIKIAIIV